MGKDVNHCKRGGTQDYKDRISFLLDDLLCRILSLLLTKHAAATIVLSKRWKNLFTSLPYLHFDDSLTGSQMITDTSNFTDFVSKILRELTTKSTNIHDIHIYCKRGTYTPFLISSWICYVSLCKLLKLLVSVNSMTSLAPLPTALFLCTTLSSLCLRGKFVLCVPKNVFFPSLKKLELSDLVLLDDKSVKRFFQGCIVLEDLYLSKCVIDTINVLEVSVASLKHLDLCDMVGDYALSLDTPYLESFYCSSYAIRGYFGDVLNFLVNGFVNFGLKDEQLEDEKVTQLVKMISSARRLGFDGDSMEPLINQSATFHNLTELRVHALNADGWLSIPNLLDHAPHLEVLFFDSGSRDVNGISLEAASCLPEHVPSCVSSHLKELKVAFFNGEEEEFKLVEYFLKNAQVLEKVTITPSPPSMSHCPILDMQTNFPIVKRLLELPRYSTTCRIVFTYWYE